ncbi:response regulator [Hyalangium sp.]|uniref:response regulator n=1 Tax=Hyalangium sp. TaxID=2028555 RepID=UPI002D5DDB3F|nr:response regulator [Hyalangium sp.]HYI01379.1 response regulator [Hyalangium sp.]
MEKPSFLFVDQNPVWLAALRRASRDLPGPKHFAGSAEEALDLVRAHQPAVVVSGYGLPEGDGLSLLEQVSEQYPRVACVLHTARPARLLRGARGIALVEKGSAPRMLEAALSALWVALTGTAPSLHERRGREDVTFS